MTASRPSSARERSTCWLALTERRERIVSKNELLDVVWPGLVVEENNLQVQIWALRKLLGADVIATIPGRGYKFTAVLEGDRKPMPAQAAEGTAPSAPPAARTPTNLPAELPLYGREADVQAVQRLVHEHRLVTITGAGGIGKTRLGQTVAHALRDSFAQGVWLIELAPLADPALVAASVAQVLGHQLRSTSAPLAELVMLLESQRVLLVIDNCEHLVEVVSPLAELLLGEAPGVHMLVTSQEPLRLPDERLYRLGTLGVPGEGEPVNAGQALEHGAVRLFVERTHALDARFVLDERNVQAVIDICGRLDGLALAIEMAAARVPALGVEGVRERLGERLRMLTAGSRIALRRHQTLRAALDWSHGLLERRTKWCSGGSGCSAAAAPSKRCSRWRATRRSTNGQCSMRSGVWWTSRSSWPTARTGRAIACSRAHARMRWKSLRRPRRPMRWRAGMRATLPRMPSASAMHSLPPAGPKTASSRRGRPSSTTSVRRSSGRWAMTGMLPSRWRCSGIHLPWIGWRHRASSPKRG